MPDANSLRHVCDLQKRTETSTSYGEGGNVTWSTVASDVRASIRPLSQTRASPEVFEGERMQARAPFEIWVRKPVWNSSDNEEIPTPGWRVSTEGRVMDVQSVREKREEGFWWQLLATEDQTRRS